MSSRRPGPRRVRGVAALGLLLALSGCAHELVTIPSTDTSAAERAVCERFLVDLPTRLAGQQERALDRNDALGAAWGDPAIILTCGGDLPDDFDRFSQCVEANGVGWFVPPEAENDQSATALITAAGYRPIVQVSVPGDYRPEGIASVMSELAGPVEDHLKLVEPCK